MTQPPVFSWATSLGGLVVGSLVLTAAQWLSNQQAGDVTYGLIELSCSGAPDLSAVLQSHRIVVTDFASALNNGTHYIVSANNTTKKIIIRMTARTDATADETGATAAGAVYDQGALIQEPSAQKQAQGYIPNELPNASQLNWLLNSFGEWTDYISQFWNSVFRASAAAWRAVTTRATADLDWIIGLGAARFDPDATDMQGEGVLKPDSGPGRGFIEAAHPDAMMAMIAAFLPEILPPVVVSLDFPSTEALATNTLTVAVPGARAGDAVKLGPPAGIEAGLSWCGFVSADDTVSVRIFKITTGTIDPAVGDWTVEVSKPNTMPVITIRGLKIFTNLIGGVYTSGTLETDLAIAANDAAFNLLVNSSQHRAALLDGGTIEAVIAGSATADAIILATGGY